MKYFGTDGVRGIANSELTCELASALGKSAVSVLGKCLVVGRDTRRSGTMLEAALVAGITSAGGNVLLAGIVPTPAVALLARKLNANGAIIISASHNAPQYNGIKFFDAHGYKLDSKAETELEDKASKHLQLPDSINHITGTGIGIASKIEDAAEIYIKQITDCVRKQDVDFSTLKIVLDCAHGASAYTSPKALKQLGAKVLAINTDFNGDDINVNCGSTHLEQLRELVLNSKSDVGIAHDGDADRTLAIDEQGNIVDGDQILAICAADMLERGALMANAVVCTVMSNLGFFKCMEGLGIKTVQTAVGDSNVLAEMRVNGFNLGGEQSGHTIFSEHNTTGDGLLTTCMLLLAVKRSGKALSELASIMQRYPQTLINVADVNKDILQNCQPVWDAVATAECELNAQGGGRVLLRASGTEPLIRVMVEAQSVKQAQVLAEALADVVRQKLATTN
ncbi:MAG: phosphoglucosamine mutase [Coriobacteriales bacterium]|jgi:phosphoglucosamine mutase|nr:phosphoglucosamine mutase [Coriobacteriales bacterium]